MPPKKKKRKPRARAQSAARRPGVTPAAEVERPDPNEKKRERIEARREEKARALAAQRRNDVRYRLIRFVVIFAAAAVFVWFFFLRNQLPGAIAGHDIEDFRTFTAESNANQLHTDQPVQYESNPPVSGPHDALPAECGVHATPIPNEKMVHNLEHGSVGILYQPTLDPAVIKSIEALVSTYDTHTFSMPYPDMDDPITVVAWAHLMRLGTFDQDATKEFIDVFREGADSPEDSPCDNASDDAFDPNASATPIPTPTVDQQAPSPANT